MRVVKSWLPAWKASEKERYDRGSRASIGVWELPAKTKEARNRHLPIGASNA